MNIYLFIDDFASIARPLLPQSRFKSCQPCQQMKYFDQIYNAHSLVYPWWTLFLFI